MLPPLLPALAAVLVLEFLNAPGFSLDHVIERLPAGVKDDEIFVRHMGARMNYAAVVLLHIFVCLCAIFYFGIRLGESPRLLRRRASVAIVLESVSVLGALVCLSYWDFGDNQPLGAYKLTYFNIRTLFEKIPASHDLVKQGYLWGVSKLSFSVVAAIAFGVFAVLMAAGVASVAVSTLSEVSEEKWLGCVRDQIQVLQQSFFLLSAVLVTSTLTATMLFYLPTETLEPHIKAVVIDPLSSYARGLAVFWGVIFTLILAAVFAPPAVILRQRIRRFAQRRDRVETASEFREWLKRLELTVSLEKQLGNVAVLIAPLLTGPIASLLQKLGG